MRKNIWQEVEWGMRMALVISALLYAFSFIFIQSLFWLIVPAFILFFLVLMSGQASFAQGFVWGVVAYGVHSFPLFWSTFYVAGSWDIFGAWVAMTLYLALPSAVLVWLAALLLSVLTGIWWRIIALALLNWFHIWWIDQGVLWIFDCVEGYPLVHPLIPLMRVPQFFYLLPCVQIEGMTFLFLLTMLMSSVCLMQFRWSFFIVLVVCLFGWFLGWYVPVRILSKPNWLRRVGILRTHYRPGQHIGAFNFVQDFVTVYDHLHRQKPLADIIITPESAAPCFLNKDRRALYALCENIGAIHLLLGGYYAHDSGGCNCCYWIDHGVVKGWYGKTHGVPFVERMPRWFDWGFLRSWFLSESISCVTQQSCETCFALLPDLLVQPSICSELFFARKLSLRDRAVAMALVNDAWFVMSCVPHSLWLLAQLRARAACVPLLYVSYHYAYFLDKTGRVWKL